MPSGPSTLLSPPTRLAALCPAPYSSRARFPVPSCSLASPAHSLRCLFLFPPATALVRPTIPTSGCSSFPPPPHRTGSSLCGLTMRGGKRVGAGRKTNAFLAAHDPKQSHLTLPSKGTGTVPHGWGAPAAAVAPPAAPIPHGLALRAGFVTPPAFIPAGAPAPAVSVTPRATPPHTEAGAAVHVAPAPTSTRAPANAGAAASSDSVLAPAGYARPGAVCGVTSDALHADDGELPVGGPVHGVGGVAMGIVTQVLVLRPLPPMPPVFLPICAPSWTRTT